MRKSTKNRETPRRAPRAPRPTPTTGSVRLTAWRAERDLTLRAAGEVFGVSASAILAWEAGTKRPRRGAVAAIAAATGIEASAWELPEDRRHLEAVVARAARVAA